MRTIRMYLAKKDIDNGIRGLEQYKQEISAKNYNFLEEVKNLGIGIIMENRGEFAPKLRVNSNHVVFASGNLQRVNIYLRQTGNVTVSWRNSYTVKTAQVSPLMMTEYGSGQFAVEGHRGTFPGQKHAFESYWTWLDMEGRQHESSGFIPKRPMHKAAWKIRSEISGIARKHFSG